MRMPIVVCWLLLAAAASPAAAQTWTYAQSDHFEVYTTGGDGRARDTLAYFERVHAFFSDFLKISPRTDTPTRLIVFANDRQYAPYRPSETAAAYYMPGPDRDYIVMGSLDRESYPIVVHEYAHLIFRHAGEVYPVWLNEGMAEFFSTMEPDGLRMTIGGVSEGRLYHLRNSGQELMDLDRLFAVGHDSPEYNTTTHAGLFYAQSWALTHMLLTERRYRDGSTRFLDLVVSGVPSAAALDQVYGRSTADVWRDLSAYIRRDGWARFVADYRSPRGGERPQTRVVEPFEAEFVTANLLAYQRHREADARAAFEQLAAQRPDDLPLADARAAFERRVGAAADAVPFLLRAVELGSVNPTFYRDLAALVPERAEEFLARLVTLSPDDVEMRVRYATAVFQAGRAGQALAVLRGAANVPQETAFYYFQLLANVYVRLDEVEAGRTAALRAVQYASPGDEAAFATRLLRTIDDYIAARAAAAEARARRPDAGADAPTAAAETAPPELSAVTTMPTQPFAPGAGVRPRPTVITVSGRVRHMICGGDAPVLDVATTEGALRLRIDDPLAITVYGTAEGTIDLHCGAQDGPLIRIGYTPRAESGRDTDGDVRVLDYREP